MLLVWNRRAARISISAYLAFGALLGYRIGLRLRLVLTAPLWSHLVEVRGGFQGGAVEDALDALIFNSRRINETRAAETKAASKRALPSQWKTCVSE